MRSFYWKWVWLTVRQAPGISDLWAGIIAAVAAFVVTRLVPEWTSVMSDLAWQIPLAVFAAVFLVRLLLAPYWIYLELQRGTDRIIGELSAENRALRDARADLEFRFRHEPPYEPRDIAYRRVGVHNSGPATAEDVEVRLLSITPSNTLPDYLLPLVVTWKDGGTQRRIAPGQEQALDVLYYQVDEFDKESRIAIQLCTVDGRATFKLRDGQQCRLHLQASAANTPLCDRRFIVRADGNTVAFDAAK